MKELVKWSDEDRILLENFIVIIGNWEGWLEHVTDEFTLCDELVSIHSSMLTSLIHSNVFDIKPSLSI